MLKIKIEMLHNKLIDSNWFRQASLISGNNHQLASFLTSFTSSRRHVWFLKWYRRFPSHWHEYNIQPNQAKEMLSLWKFRRNLLLRAKCTSSVSWCSEPNYAPFMAVILKSCLTYVHYKKANKVITRQFWHAFGISFIIFSVQYQRCV